MSELQIALLAIGVGVVVAVYAYGWWQQRRYRRKFGAAFKASHADALYQDNAARPVAPVQEPALADLAEEAIAGAAPCLDETGAARVEQAIIAPGTTVEPVTEAPVHPLSEEPCALLDMHSDFVIEMHLAEPSPAAVLDGLWQRKFDFGKPVQVCGLTLAAQQNEERSETLTPASSSPGQWEQAIAESPTLHVRFRIALQLVDRSGAINAAKLADFRDLVLGIAKKIKADTTVPDMNETHRHAIELDAFCAEVDRMVGINLIPPGERLLSGGKIAQAAASFGMKLESDGAFHLSSDTRGWQGVERRRASRAQKNDRRRASHSLFALVNMDAKPFQHHTLENTSTAGITLLLDLPRVENPATQFDYMVRVAHELARELQVNLVDDYRVLLSDNGLAHIRTQIAGVEAKMREHGIAPGSAQARRLFV